MTSSTQHAPKTRLVVLYGGRSAEHDVSCVSAANVLAVIDPSRYDVVAIGVTREGRWVMNDDPRMFSSERSAQSDHLEAIGTVVDPLPVLMRNHPDQTTVALALVHGPYGEDGTLQGMLELADVPYVGSGVLGSAICMDKTMAKTLTAAAGIPQVRAFNLTPGSGGPDALASRAEALMSYAEIEFPVFVKPANLGSSVGISKARDHDEFVAALELALTYDERLVVEETVQGREIEVAVLGNSIADNAPRASIPGEIVPAAEFYDFADKYASDAATLLIPAELDPDEVAAVQDLALEAYAALRCDGMARVDFFYEPRGRGFLLNEINTIPGFTPASMYPKLWEASGLGYAELIDELIGLALDRHARRSGFCTDP